MTNFSNLFHSKLKYLKRMEYYIRYSSYQLERDKLQVLAQRQVSSIIQEEPGNVVPCLAKALTVNLKEITHLTVIIPNYSDIDSFRVWMEGIKQLFSNFHNCPQIEYSDTSAVLQFNLDSISGPILLGMVNITRVIEENPLIPISFGFIKKTYPKLDLYQQIVLAHFLRADSQQFGLPGHSFIPYNYVNKIPLISTKGLLKSMEKYSFQPFKKVQKFSQIDSQGSFWSSQIWGYTPEESVSPTKRVTNFDTGDYYGRIIWNPNLDKELKSLKAKV